MGSCVFQYDVPHQWIAWQVSPVSVHCDGVGCHVMCLYTVTGWGVMSCVYCDGVGCHVLCLYTGVGCHVLCLYTVTGGVSCPVYTVMEWGVMSCVCILWRGGVSCPVSVYCDGVGCHVLCLYTVTGWGVMSCVYCDGVGCHVLCLYTVKGWGVMSCVCILWRGGVSCPVSVYCDGVGCHVLWHGIPVWQYIGQNSVPLLQAGTVALWLQMFKSDVKLQQTIMNNV